MSERKSVFIFGINPVLEKLRHAPAEVSEIMLVAGSSHGRLRSIAREATQLGLPVRFVNSSLLSRLSVSGRHQGVVAKVSAYVYYPIEDVLREVSVRGRPSWILALDGITDPHNFGALLRTAEGVGIHHVVIPEDRAAGVTPTVVKSSAGAANYLKIARVTNLRRALMTFKENGFWVVGLDAEATKNIYGTVYPDKLVVVLGSEGSGMRPLIRGECDFLVSIPQRGKVGSLNVAVAGGVFFYEVLRQQGHGGVELVSGKS